MQTTKTFVCLMAKTIKRRKDSPSLNTNCVRLVCSQFALATHISQIDKNGTNFPTKKWKCCEKKLATPKRMKNSETHAKQ